MTASRLHADFLPSPRGRLFVVWRLPAGSQGPAVLLVPPFAEEMNKSRRLCTDLAQALNRQGIAVVLPDLHGTGDSEGDFGDADWAGWVDDLRLAAAFAGSIGWPVRGLLGIRLGCQLAADFSRLQAEPVQRSVFWQPVTDGGRFLSQFLRLRVAARIMTDGQESVSQLRSRLAAEGRLDVAGYTLGAGLAAAIEQRNAGSCLDAALGELTVIEVPRPHAEPGMSAAAKQLLDAAAALSIDAAHASAAGEPFWSATEIVRNAMLVSRSTECFAGLSP